MSDTDLDRECEVFTRMLVGRSPTPYVVGKYAEAHRHLPELTPAHPLDLEILRIARHGPGWCRLADTLAVRVRKTATLRVKLIVMVAILERVPRYFQLLDRPVRVALRTVLALTVRGLTAVMLTLAAAAALTPLLGLARLRRGA